MESKFRGYCKDRKEWVYGNFFYWIKRDERIPIIGEGVQNGSVMGSEVVLESVGRFIGTKDIYRKEVYQGDIIEFDNSDIGGEKYFGEVQWNQDPTLDQLCFGLWTKKGWLKTNFLGEILILGNAFENNDLILNR